MTCRVGLLLFNKFAMLNTFSPGVSVLVIYEFLTKVNLNSRVIAKFTFVGRFTPMTEQKE